MNKVLLDSSFILEILLKRKKQKECLKILNQNESLFCISLLTVHHTHYFARKASIEIIDVYRYLKEFDLLTISELEYYKALEVLKDTDLEDAMQIACALNNDCDTFITLDDELQKKYWKDIIIIRI